MMSQEELKNQKVVGKVDSALSNFISNIIDLVYRGMLFLMPFVVTFGILGAGIIGIIFGVSSTYEYTDSGLAYAIEFGYEGSVEGIDDYLRGDVYSKYVLKELTPKQMDLYEGYVEIMDNDNYDAGNGYFYKAKGINFLRRVILIISLAVYVGSICFAPQFLANFW